MKELATYIEEGFYKNIGSSKFVKNCYELMDFIISNQYDSRCCEGVKDYDITIDKEEMTIKFTSKRGKPSVLFNLYDKENVEKLSDVDLTNLYSINLWKKGKQKSLDVNYDLPDGTIDFFCLSPSSDVREGFYSNVHTSPLDTVRDFILDNEDIVLNGTVIERMKLVNKLAEVFQSEYDRVGAFAFQFEDNCMRCAVKIDGDNSRWKWESKNTKRHWGKPHTIKQIAQEVVYYQLQHQSGDFVNFELI